MNDAANTDHDPWWLSLARTAVPGPVRRQLHRWRERRIIHHLRQPGVHEQALSETLDRLVSPGMTVADVGANIGKHTLALADRVGGGGHVFAFEPFPGNVERLRYHARVAGMTDLITIRAAAVSDGTHDRVALHPGRDHSGAEWNIVGHDANGTATDAELYVPAIRLDDMFTPADPLDVVKIDVEGAEGLVLKGMAHILEAQRPALVIEVHDKDNWAACHALASAGYTLQSLAGSPLGVTDPMQGHLVALPAAARGRAAA